MAVFEKITDCFDPSFFRAIPSIYKVAGVLRIL